MKALWDGNRIEGVNGKPPTLVSDGCVAIFLRRAAPGRFLERLLRPHRMAARLQLAKGYRVMRSHQAKPTKEMHLLSGEYPMAPFLYVELAAVRGAKRTVWVNGHRLEVIRRATKWDRITQARGGTVLSALTFWRGKRPVAILMPLNAAGFNPKLVNKETQGDR